MTPEIFPEEFSSTSVGGEVHLDRMPTPNERPMTQLRNLLIAAVAALQTFSLLGDDNYNCHNYAWESSRRWLDDPSPYITRATECRPERATKIVYFSQGKPIHSGLYLGHGWVKSKWGANPVVVHPISISTYGTDVRFYR